MTDYFPEVSQMFNCSCQQQLLNTISDDKLSNNLCYQHRGSETAPSPNALDRKHLAVLNTWSGHTASEQPFRCFVLSQNLKLYPPVGGALSWVGGQYLSNIT